MENKLKIREYIYIDDVFVNSLLSQFDNGLVETISRTNEAINGKVISINDRKNNSIEGSVKIIKGEHGHSKEQINQTNTQDINSSTINTIFYDYAVEKLESELLKNKLIKHSSGGEITLGSFINVEDNATFYDFKELEDLLEIDGFKKVIKENIDKEHEEEFEQNINYTKMTAKIMGTSKLISIKNNLIVTKDDCFRISKSQFQLFKNNNRKLTVLGIVESNFKQSNLNWNEWEKMTSNTKFVLLNLLGVINDNTNLVLPIAAYFK